MQADHRHAYAGDHGITFELRDDEEARAIYQEIVGKPAKKSILREVRQPDARVCAAKHLIRFKDNRERGLFARQIGVYYRRFEELSLRFQQLVLEAEKKRSQGNGNSPQTARKKRPSRRIEIAEQGHKMI
jgi:hypothetical protein